jgi:hypothetical protein
MKRLILSLAVIILAFSASGQTADIIWTQRMTPKTDKIGEIEKKLPVFLKTHYPQLSFRVYEVITGPNTGSYVIATGPYMFKDMDAPMTSPKGEAAQQADGLALMALCESVETNFNRMIPEISIPDPKRELKFIQVTTREYEMGSWGIYRDFLTKLKVAREKGPKVDLVYFEPVAGGTLNSFVAVRYFNKWEELDMSQNLPELYDNAHGRAAWSKALTEINRVTKTSKQEVRVLRKDLSTTAAK